MAKFTKKIKKKMDAPRRAAEEEAKDIEATVGPQRTYRPWETYVIVGILLMTIFLVAGSWGLLSASGRIMYVILIITLILMYMQRRMTKLTKSQSVWLGRAIVVLLGASVVAFLFSSYNTYFS